MFLKSGQRVLAEVEEEEGVVVLGLRVKIVLEVPGVVGAAVVLRVLQV